MSNKKSKQEYKGKMVKCPCCDEVFNINQLIEVGRTKDKKQDILIARKLKERGYEFGLLEEGGNI